METTIISLLIIIVGYTVIRVISKRKGMDVRRAQIPRRYWLPIIIIVIVVLSSLGVIAYFHDKNWKSPSITEVSPMEDLLEIGKTYPIKWQSTGIDKVRISLVNYDCISRIATTTIAAESFSSSDIASDAIKIEVCFDKKIIDNFPAKDKVYNWSVPTDLFSVHSAWQPGDNFQISIAGLNKTGKIMDSKDSPNRFYIVSSKKAADWQTYRNEEYGFEIQYLKDWDYMVDDYNNSRTIGFYPKGTKVCCIVDLTIYSGVGLQEKYDKTKQVFGAYTITESTIDVDSVQGRLFTIKEAWGGSYLKKVFFEKNNHIYEFSTGIGFEPLFYQMLSTLKFIKPVSQKLYIKVISPNGGERWTEGNIYNIIWDASGIEKVAISIASGGKDLGLVVFGIDAKSGKYSWQIPDDFIASFGVSGSDLMRIRVCDNDNPNPVCDENDNFFSISRP